MSLSERDITILVENAANVTGSLLSGTGTVPVDTDVYQATLDAIYEINRAKVAAALSVESFPGAVVLPSEAPLAGQQVQSNVVPFPQTAQPAQVGAPVSPFPPQPTGPPAVIPGAAAPPADDEALWRDLFANPGNWEDVRGKKQSEDSPDFKHKFQNQTKPAKNGRYYPLSLWISGRNTPAWVHQSFGGAA